MTKIRFDITLSLAKDTIPLTNNEPESNYFLKASNYTMTVKFPFALIKRENIMGQSQYINTFPNTLYLKPKSSTLQQTNVQFSNFQQQEQQRQDTIRVNFLSESSLRFFEDEESSNYYPFYSFLPQITVSYQTQRIYTLIRQRNLNLTLSQISKAKFVNNEKLKRVINAEGEESGVLSMDQSGRIMVEGQECRFPAIGIWEKNTKQLDQISTYIRISEFLCNMRLKKCRFCLNGNSFIYYVKFGIDQSSPRLFMVSWVEEPEIRQIYQDKLPNFYQTQTKQITIPTITLDCEFSGMELTLRNNSYFKEEDETTKTSLKYYSPIKQIYNKDIQQQLDRFSPALRSRKLSKCDESFGQQGSPSFRKYDQTHLQYENSQIKSYDPYESDDRESLIKKLRIRDEEVDYLKTQVKKLRNAIRLISESEITSTKNFEFAKSPYIEVNYSTAKVNKKKLSESDLNTSPISSIKKNNTIDFQGSIQFHDSWSERIKVIEQSKNHIHMENIDQYLEDVQVIDV